MPKLVPRFNGRPYVGRWNQIVMKDPANGERVVSSGFSSEITFGE
jgi:hypothetical protein